MSAADDFNKILFADAVLDLLAAKVVERLAATGGGQDKAAGVQVKVESGQDWVSAKVARAVLGRSDSWLHRTAQQHPEIKRSMKQPHPEGGASAVQSAKDLPNFGRFRNNQEPRP